MSPLSDEQRESLRKAWQENHDGILERCTQAFMLPKELAGQANDGPVAAAVATASAAVALHFNSKTFRTGPDFGCLHWTGEAG